MSFSSEQPWRTVAIVALIASGVLLTERLGRGYWLAADEPRPVTPRGAFTGEEKRTTELFAQVAASVASIYARRGGSPIGSRRPFQDGHCPCAQNSA